MLSFNQVLMSLGNVAGQGLSRGWKSETYWSHLPGTGWCQWHCLATASLLAPIQLEAIAFSGEMLVGWLAKKW